MGKRFTATEKWDDPWFFKLESNYKLAWLFLLDKCDSAGFWNVNEPLIIFHIGFFPDLEKFGGRIEVVNPDKWFIPKFISFQYGELSESNKAHQSVINRLKKEGLYKPIGSPLEGAKDKEEEKEQESLREEGGVGEEEKKVEPDKPTPEMLMQLWNDEAPPLLARAETLSPSRKVHATTRLNEHPDLDYWLKVMAKIKSSKLLRGEVQKGLGGPVWKPTFDWILNANNLAKIIDGNYDDKR